MAVDTIAMPNASLLEGLSQRLCQHAVALTYDDIPQDVIHCVKLFVLDTLGVIAASKSAPGIETLLRRLSQWEANGSATVLLGKHRMSPPSAAFANGAAAHALDFDDIHDEARVHTCAVLLPTLLAIAEDMRSVSGRRFILAMALGLEINARLGLTCFNCLDHGWHPTMLFGTMSSALAGACLLGEPVEHVLGAFGFGHHLASGSAQSILDRALTKRVGPGIAARSAVTAALLSADGISGPEHPLEGRAGLFHLQERDEVKPERLLAGFGRDWEVTRYGFKLFPCCRCCHSTIDLGLQLHQRRLKSEDVASIEIWQPAVNFRTVGAPYDASLDSIVHAQFNAAYCFARALCDGSIDVRTFQRPQITAPDILALTQRTKVMVDESMDPIAMGPARVRLTLTSGDAVTVESAKLLGGPEAPVSDTLLLSKFRSCFLIGLNTEESAVEALAELVLDLEQVKDVAALVARFPG